MTKRGSKKAQVTVFVLIAIVLVAGVLFYLLVMPKITKPALSAEEAQKLLASQIDPIKTYVENCMEASAIKTINTMGRQGGYRYLRSDRYTYPIGLMEDASAINYALFKDKTAGYVNFLPSLEEMKAEMIASINGETDFTDCINEFESFKNIMDVNAGNFTINTSNIDFGETSGQIVIPFKYPIELSRSGSTTSLEDYTIAIPINMYKIREVAGRVINSIAAGNAFEKVISDEAQIQEVELRANSESSEQIAINSFAFSNYATEESGVTYNSRNTLFRIEYQNSALDKPFLFYFAVGNEF